MSSILVLLWRWVSRLVGTLIVLYVAYYAYSATTAKERMTAVCNQIKPGMTSIDLLALAEENGLGPRPRKVLGVEKKLVYLAEIRTFGRHACKVELEAGFVKRSTYNYAD